MCVFDFFEGNVGLIFLHQLCDKKIGSEWGDDAVENQRMRIV